MTQNLKTAYFMQNFMELDIKKVSGPKAVIFGVWGQKSSRTIWPKAICKRLIKLLDENPSFNFQKQDLIFSRIIK